MNCSIERELPHMSEIYDGKHEPVISRAPLKNAEVVTPGTVLKIGTDNLTVEKASASDTPYAIALEGATGKDSKVYINVLIHGTVRREALNVSGAAITAATIVKLNSIGIYA